MTVLVINPAEIAGSRYSVQIYCQLDTQRVPSWMPFTPLGPFIPDLYFSFRFLLFVFLYVIVILGFMRCHLEVRCPNKWPLLHVPVCMYSGRSYKKKGACSWYIPRISRDSFATAVLHTVALVDITYVHVTVPEPQYSHIPCGSSFRTDIGSDSHKAGGWQVHPTREAGATKYSELWYVHHCTRRSCGVIGNWPRSLLRRRFDSRWCPHLSFSTTLPTITLPPRMWGLW